MTFVLATSTYPLSALKTKALVSHLTYVDGHEDIQGLLTLGSQQKTQFTVKRENLSKKTLAWSGLPRPPNSRLTKLNNSKMLVFREN